MPHDTTSSQEVEKIGQRLADLEANDRIGHLFLILHNDLLWAGDTDGDSIAMIGELRQVDLAQRSWPSGHLVGFDCRALSRILNDLTQDLEGGAKVVIEELDE